MLFLCIFRDIDIDCLYKSGGDGYFPVGPIREPLGCRPEYNVQLIVLFLFYKLLGILFILGKVRTP